MQKFLSNFGHRRKQNDTSKNKVEQRVNCVVILLFVAVFQPYYERFCQEQVIFASKHQDLEKLRQENVPIVWVLGGPGSGKGTQCEKIVAKYGFTHLSSGDLLRAEVASGSDLGKELTAIMEKGELVSNDIVLGLLKNAIISKANGSKGFLIDGYPREKDQGVAFEEQILPCTVILYFEASADTLTKRILARAINSGRADDNEETIKLRLNTFLKNNDQVLALYPEKLRKIPAEGAVDAIFAQVETYLDPLVKSK